jgi:hypothetical protein
MEKTRKEVEMTRDRDTIWCDGCGVEITWVPLIIADRDYCCEDCAEGLTCGCEPPVELEDERRGGRETPQYFA